MKARFTLALLLCSSAVCVAEDDSYINSILVVEGTHSQGTAFVVETGDESNKRHIYTNVHVLSGNEKFNLLTLDGKELTPRTFQVSKTRDLAIAECISNVSGLQLMDGVDEKIKIGDEVFVFGNSAGEKAIRKIEGKVKGIGPDVIEVSAEFIEGNSGGPIIHKKSGLVIGIATYAVVPRVTRISNNTEFSEVRRFGIRIDNDRDFEAPTWERFVRERRKLDEFRGDTYLLAAVLVHTVSPDSSDPFAASNWMTFQDYVTKKNFGNASSLFRVQKALKDYNEASKKRTLSKADKEKAELGFYEAMAAECNSGIKDYKIENFSGYHKIYFKGEVSIRERIKELFKAQVESIKIK